MGSELLTFAPRSLRKLQATAHIAQVSYLFSDLQTRFSFLGCSDSSEDVAGISGNPLWLRPSNIQTKILYVEWKKTQLGSPGNNKKIELLVRYNHNKKKISKISNGFNKTYDFNDVDFALGIKSAKLQDSGQYELEITNHSGKVCSKKFQILVFGEFLALLTLPQFKLSLNSTDSCRTCISRTL